MAALAEYTITRPKKISSATVVKSTRSNASFFAIRTSPVVALAPVRLLSPVAPLAAIAAITAIAPIAAATPLVAARAVRARAAAAFAAPARWRGRAEHRPHLRLEDLAAVAEVAELIEAGAGGRQHHRLARHGVPRGRPHRGGERAGELQRRRAAERPLELARGLADQVEAPRFRPRQRRQRREVGALVAAAEDQVHRAVREALERLDGRRRIGALRVVVPGHPALRRHLLHTVRQPAEAGEAAADCLRARLQAARQESRRHGVLEVLHAGERHLRGGEQGARRLARRHLHHRARAGKVTAVVDRTAPREEAAADGAPGAAGERGGGRRPPGGRPAGPAASAAAAASVVRVMGSSAFSTARSPAPWRRNSR